MTASLLIARDEIQAAFKTRWDLDSAAVNGGTIPPVAYEGVPFIPPQAAPWARIVLRHTGGRQASLAGDTAKIRTEKTGIVIVSVFAPIEKGQGVKLARDLATVAKRAFEGKATASQVWFRNVVATEVGADGGTWFQINVTAIFEYDEFPS